MARGRRGTGHGARPAGGRRCAPRMPFRRRGVRPGDRGRGARAHPRRPAGDERDRAGAAPGRPAGGDRAGLAAGADLLAAVGRLPQRPRRPRPHLHPARAGGQAPAGGADGRRPPPRARPALALLVAEVRGRGGRRRSPAGPRLPPAAGLGHHEAPGRHPGGRTGAEPAHRQEPGRLRPQARPGGRHRPWGQPAAGTPLAAARAAWRVRMPVRENPAQVGPAPAPATAGHATHPRPRPRRAGRADRGRLLATGDSIAAVQEPSGAIGWPDGHIDAWNHVECAMALSACGLRDACPARLRLAARAASGPTGPGRSRRPPAAWSPTRPPRATRPPTSRSASGTSFWSPGTRRSRRGCGPRCAAPSTSCSALQTPRGEIAWERAADGSPARLRPADRVLQHLPEPALRGRAGRVRRASRSPTGNSRPTSSGTWWRSHPEAFADKSQFSMDWYYPVLGGPVRGPDADGPPGRALARLRGPGPRRPLRQRRALGHRRGDLRARARARRDRRPRPGAWSCSATSSTCGTPAAATGPAGSS